VRKEIVCALPSVQNGRRFDYFSDLTRQQFTLSLSKLHVSLVTPNVRVRTMANVIVVAEVDKRTATTRQLQQKPQIMNHKSFSK